MVEMASEKDIGDIECVFMVYKLSGRKETIIEMGDNLIHIYLKDVFFSTNTRMTERVY